VNPRWFSTPSSIIDSTTKNQMLKATSRWMKNVNPTSAKLTCRANHGKPFPSDTIPQFVGIFGNGGW